MPSKRSSQSGSGSGSGKSKGYGKYIVLGGQRLALKKHPTDFSIIGRSAAPESSLSGGDQPLAPNMTRLTAASASDVDALMSEARRDAVSHHIYQVEATDEEIIIDDRIFLELDHDDEPELQAILEQYRLVSEGRMGSAYVLRVTEATGQNPLKTANEIAERESVRACSPQVMVELIPSQQPALFADQWYLTADLIANADLLPDADIQAPEAWQITTGDPNVVVAVIDDGFDLGHPAFANTRIHPEPRDFQGVDNDPSSEDLFIGGFNDGDYHGTPVASIAVGSHDPDSAMRGIAPGCTFLPIRLGFGQFATQVDILDVFRYASDRADVVNCSFGTPPRSFDVFSSSFRSEITRLTESGGRRGRGLVMVFAAGNEDAPTFLSASDNTQGVKFASGGAISEIPAGNSVRSGYPLTPGVVVVSSMTSLKRKSGYSSWGPQITVAAPSNNQHYITSFVQPGSDPRRDLFIANYRGLGQVAAANRPGNGASFQPIQPFDNPATPLRENFYTVRFGGTSGAAPVVTGVVGLMLSVNSELTAAQVRQILMATADRDLDPVLDLADDPNVQGLSGDFVNERSLWFGSGKVNALRAVSRAQALAGGGPVDPVEPVEPPPRILRRQVSPGIPIPDNRPQGIVSLLNVNSSGILEDITVDVDIRHTFRGDLRVVLVSPQGLIADLHRFSGGAQHDLTRSFSPADTPDLANLVAAGIDVEGRWILFVSDNAFRDVGTLDSWGLTLRVT